MRKIILLAAIGATMIAGILLAQNRSSVVQDFVQFDAPVIALEHVRVIDGAGAAPVEDQTIVIVGGRIRSLGASTKAEVPSGARGLDRHGYTVIPGLVGMHDHLFYPVPEAKGGPPLYVELAFSAPRLYLAGGVTSLRTTGSIEPYTDLSVKRLIDSGRQPGPKIHVTGPYLEGHGAYTPNMHELADADEARRTVEYWAGEGVTSFKAYMDITRAELSSAIEAAHQRGLKVTGHLCSIGFREAAALGIDDLEHGLLVDTEFVPGKQPDVCPPAAEQRKVLDNADIEGQEVQETIRDLVSHHVAVTSTLPVFETLVGERPPLQQRVLDALAPQWQTEYLAIRAAEQQ